MRKKIFIFYFAICTVLIIVGGWAEVEFPLNTSRLIDRAIAGDNILELTVILGIDVLLIICTESLLQIAKKKFLNLMAHKYRISITSSMLDEEDVIPSETKKSEYISCFNNDIPMVIEEYYSNVFQIIQTITTVLFSLSALLTLNVRLLFLIILQILLLAINPILFRKGMQDRKKRVSSAKSFFNHTIRNYIEGIHIVRTYLCENIMQKMNAQASLQVNQAEYQDTKLQMFANLFSLTAGYLCNFLIIVVGVLFIVSGELTAGALLAVLQITDLLANPITTVSYYVNSMLSVKPIKEKLDCMTKRIRPFSGTSQCDKMKMIEIKDLSISRKNYQILNKISVTLHYGNKYLLIGENGSGKSTLLKTLFQLFEGYQGEILYNGKNIRECTLESFYSHVTMVFQESYIFPDSLENNITLYHKYPEEDVEWLIERLHLTKFRKKTLNSDELSGGERQRIALARAVIRHPDLLLVDEVTSSLDSKSQHDIEKFILNLPCCVVHISHHNYEKFAENYDEVLYLSNGALKEKKDLQK